MDETIRKKLRTTVTRCRALLEEAIMQVLEGTFGIRIAGKTVVVEDAATMTHLAEPQQRTRTRVLGHLDHITAGGTTRPAALEQLVREVAFTHLNRLCAYKMMETRKLIRETVSRGTKSNGFLFYLADHDEDEQRYTSGETYTAYCNYLRWLGTTLSDEIGVLFSPHDLANDVFPKQQVLDQLLDLINDPSLHDIWSKDETVGWIYQYFTPKELRDHARKQSAAPRNSYELAFRNQFYTPRYVVRFLVDNTLGRMWYAMRQGNTRLLPLCSLCLCGENIPVPPASLKDPRDIRILDPACGSGHFLLYCFDLLLIIYEEAWEDPTLPPAEATGTRTRLCDDYPTREALQSAIPGLILRYNIHGVDIDMRATQIAALALWLRAQRAYDEAGIKRGDRPQITRVNIVCAEPMPGNTTLLTQFLHTIDERLHALVRTIFERMTLAGEAGTLLKIEQDIQDAIKHARVERLIDSPPMQITFFEQDSQPVQQVIEFATAEEREFWDQAEALLLAALQRYAETASETQRLQRQLFADDAARGFAFVDLCRKQFSVVLMNPPFGAASSGSKALIERSYPRTKNDVYAAFVERGIALLHPGGMLGAITSRTGLFLSSFQKWREEILLHEATPVVVADLGYGVLDTAMVETAAYCLEKRCDT